MRRPLVMLTLAILCGIALDSCGGDTEGAANAPAIPADVEVVALDVKFDRTAYQATSGEVELRYVNKGSIAHTLVLDGQAAAFKLEVGHRGDADSAAVDLEPGTYRMYCDVPGHREAGMEATLKVTE